MLQEPPLSLSARRESILRTLIETYYREKEPVGSSMESLFQVPRFGRSSRISSMILC